VGRVTGAAPHVAPAAEQVFGFVGAVRGDSRFIERKVHGSRPGAEHRRSGPACPTPFRCHHKKRGPDTLSALHPVPKKIKTKRTK